MGRPTMLCVPPCFSGYAPLVCRPAIRKWESARGMAAFPWLNPPSGRGVLASQILRSWIHGGDKSRGPSPSCLAAPRVKDHLRVVSRVLHPLGRHVFGSSTGGGAASAMPLLCLSIGRRHLQRLPSFTPYLPHRCISLRYKPNGWNM
jgi:hypothetical protein